VYAQRIRRQQQASDSGAPDVIAEAMEVEPPQAAPALAQPGADVQSDADVAAAGSEQAATAGPVQQAGAGTKRQPTPKPALRRSSSETPPVADSSGAGSVTKVPDEDEAKRGRKKVRFADPWSPPHKRQGGSSDDTPSRCAPCSQCNNRQCH
jgi:hypothetical protein